MVNHIEKNSGNNFVIFSTGLEIVKSVAEIEFESSSALYADGLVQTVAQNVTNGTFNVEGNSKYKFTYSFDKLTLVFTPDSNPIGVYTGSGDPTTDQEKFEIAGLKITLNGVNVTNNFDWAISPNSTFEVLGGEDYTVKEFRYSSRYQSASNGALTALTSGWGEGSRQNTFTISNITYGGSPVVINNKSQYSHVVGETVVFTIIGNGSYSLAVLVNQDAIGSNALTYNVTVSSPLEPTLALIAWQNNENTIGGDLFGTTLPNATISQTYSSGGQENTYAVFTDVVKVSVDFNLSDLDPQTQTLFVSSAGYSLANPSDNSGELAFGGYQADGSGLEVTGGQGSTSLKTTSAGTTATLKTKWNLLADSSKIALKEGMDDITTSIMAEPTYMYVENIVSASFEKATVDSMQVYKIEDGERKALNTMATAPYRAEWLYKDGQYALKNNAGDYVVAITYSYEDGVQAEQSYTKELSFKITNEPFVYYFGNIEVAQTGADIFANRDLVGNFKLSFEYEATTIANGYDKQKLEEALNNAPPIYFNPTEEELAQPTSVKEAYDKGGMYTIITTPYPEDENGDAIFNAGEYTIEFKVWDVLQDYVEMKAAEGASLTQTITVKPDTIDLADYNSQITPSKLAGTSDQTQSLPKSPLQQTATTK